MNITEQITQLIEPIAQERNYFIVDITYMREGGRFVLRVTLDREGGITMDECARLNNELSELLDKENIITDEYILEVSSPGLDRKLKTNRDFVWALGKKVKVNTFLPLDGKNVFSGTLIGVGDSTIVLEENGISWEIPKEKISKARLAFSA